jgi:MFS family permease
MDLAFESVGTNGKFQKTISIVIITVASMALLSGIAFPFLTKKPEMLCREKWNELSSFHSCHEEEICNNNHIEYLKNPYNNLYNMAYEFDMYCDNAYFSGVIGTSFFFGGIIGSLFLSPIPDNYGREKIYKILLFCVFLIHLSFLLSSSLVGISVINFIAGVVSYCYSMSTLIITEYLDRKFSGIIMSLNNAVFPLTGILLAFFFMYINNWRILYVITSFITFLTAMLGYKFFLESPRWLNSKNRMTECFDTLKKIAVINGKEKNFQSFMEANATLVKSSSDLNEVKKGYNLFEILRLKSQRKKFLLLIYIWFASGFCFYGLILNIEHLGGDIFIDSIITFAAEIISELSSGYMADEFGRVIVLELSGAIGGAAFILWELTTNPNWLKSVFVFITSFGFSATFNTIYIYSPESFPTTIRSTAMGFLFLISRLGALLVPSVSAIVPHNPIFFGILAIISAYCSTMLPETLGSEIPDDVPESKRAFSFLSKSGINSDKKYMSPMNASRKTIISDFYFKVEQG